MNDAENAGRVVYLLDTNIISYILRGNFPALDHRLSRVSRSILAISVVTEAELLFGVERKPGANNYRADVEKLMSRFTSLPWDSAVARSYARLRAALESSGTPLGALDTMIAAHAMSLDATLVTRDKAFARVKGLKTEDWTRA